MANIIGRLTNNEVEILQVDAAPGSGGGTSAAIGTIAAYNDGSAGTAYLKTGASDTAWDLINTAAVAGGVLTGVGGRLPVYPSSGNQVDDVYTQNSQTLVISHAAHPTRSTNITYTIPNPGDAITGADFVLTEGSQVINGVKTFGNNIIINGDLTVNGTTTTVNSTVTEISDPTITLNNGGAAASGGGAGIEIEENAAVTAFMTVAAARNGWTFKAPTIASNATLLMTSLTANRSYTLPDLSGTFALGSAAPGQVAYWSGANLLAGNANFFWDNTNGRLGIGNGAPSVELHVTGSARITSLNAAAPVRSSAAGVLSNGTIVLSATSDVSGILPIANGGTNASATLNNNRIMVSSGGSIVEAAALTNGQLLIGSTGAAPVAAAPIQGAFASVTIGLGAGSLTLDTIQDIRVSASPTFVNAILSGKTAGSVLFAGTAGLIEQDNANFFWDNANNRLGLGNATPARQLDVTGSSVFRAPIRYSDAAASNANWEMFQAEVTTTNATATTLQSITVPTDSTMFLRVKIIGRRTGGSAGANGDSAIYERTARFKNIGGTVTINSLQSDFTSEELTQLLWNGTLDVSGTTARIRVTGAANNNITWTATYEVITLS